MEAIVVVNFQRCCRDQTGRVAGRPHLPIRRIPRVNRRGLNQRISRVLEHRPRAMARSFRTACLLAARSRPRSARSGDGAVRQSVRGAVRSRRRVRPSGVPGGGHRRRRRRSSRAIRKQRRQAIPSSSPIRGRRGRHRRRRRPERSRCRRPVEPRRRPTARRPADLACLASRPASASRAARRSRPTPRRSPATRSSRAAVAEDHQQGRAVLRARQDHRPHHHFRRRRSARPCSSARCR